MAAVRTATKTGPAVQLANATAVDFINASEVVTMLSDRQTLLLNGGPSGFDQNKIRVSVDGGVTVTSGDTLGATGFKISGAVETLDGELLVSLQRSDNTQAGSLVRSTGWNKTTGKATSWATVLTCSGPGCAIDRRWGLTAFSVAPAWSPRPGLIVVNEYGTKVNEAIAAGRTSDTAAVRAWLSTDHGKTWTVLFDLRDRYPGVNGNLHCHASAYDPYDDRVIVTQGDGGFADGASAAVWYCDGENLTAPTWTRITGTASTDGQAQVVTVAPLTGGVLFLSDGGPASVRRLPRRGYRRYGSMVDVVRLGNGAIIGATMWRSREGSPLWITCYTTSSSGNPSILMTLDGETFSEVYRSASPTTGSSPGIHNVVGPDVSGRVYGNQNLTGTSQLFSADYQPDQTSAASNTLATGTTTPAVHSDSASRYGLLAQTFAAHMAGSTSTALASGTLYLMAVTAEADAAAAARSVRLYQAAAAASATLVKAAVFDSNGNQLGVSADQSSTFNTAGPTTRTVSVGSFALTKGATYYVAVLVVATTGPTLARSSSSGAINAGLAGAALLWATGGTALTDMPATITPSTNAAQPLALWVGLL